MLVTGASSGIGRALALRAARAGYAVFAIGRNTDALAALEEKIAEEGGTIVVDAMDVSDPANAPGIIRRALASFGRLDVLVNNAGTVARGPLAMQTDAQLQAQFGTHVIGPVALVREALMPLRSAGGQVFMLGSGVARVPVGGLGAYPPSKAAVRSATSILRRELQPFGICVTYVDPGAVDTAFMTRAGMPGAPSTVLVTPEFVARRILIAVTTRPRVLNVVGWQTAAVAMAEFFPRITDAILERRPDLVGGNDMLQLAPNTVDALPSHAQALPSSNGTTITADMPAVADEPIADATPSIDERFDRALEPHRRRMSKLSFRESFVRDLLVPGADLDAADVALRWAGMPNKIERAITIEVLDALADEGLLERGDDQHYTVVTTA